MGGIPLIYQQRVTLCLEQGNTCNVVYVEDEQEWPKYWHLWDSRCYRKSTGRWAICAHILASL